MIEAAHTSTPTPAMPAPGPGDRASTPKQTEHPKFRWSHIFVELGSVDEILQPIRSSSRLKYTSITVSASYVAVGSSTGAVYIFHKESLKWLHHLTNDKEGSVTQLSFSPDDNVLAHACSNGHVTVTELNIQKRASPRRLRLSVDHKGSVITSLEWNPQGTLLFIGDDVGRVSVAKVTTSITKDLLQVPSEIILRLDSKVVQLSLYDDKLVISTLKKTYLCNTVKREYSQIGKQDRNGTFGSIFFQWPKWEPPVILCARPRSRVWQVNGDGQVVHTHQFKEMLNIPSLPIATYKEEETSFPDPEERCAPKLVNFNRLKQFGDRFVFTWSTDGLYVFNPHDAMSIFWSPFKDVVDFSTYRNDVFILDSMSHVTKLTLLPAERSVIKLFEHSLWKQSASSAYFFKALIHPEAVRRHVWREKLLDLRDKFVNNKCDTDLKKVEEILDLIKGGEEEVPPLVTNSQSTIRVLDSGIHVVNRPHRSDSELSDQSFGALNQRGRSSGEYLREIVTRGSPKVQNVENVALFALDNQNSPVEKTCPMLSIRGPDLDAMLSKSLVVSSPETEDILKYDINQNNDSKNEKNSLEDSDNALPALTVSSGLETVFNQTNSTHSDTSQLAHGISESAEVPALGVPGVNGQFISCVDDTTDNGDTLHDHDTLADGTTDSVAEDTCSIDLDSKDNFCDIDLRSTGELGQFSHSSGEVDQETVQVSAVILAHTTEELSVPVKVPVATENMLPEPTVLRRRASDSNLVGLDDDSPSSARRESLTIRSRSPDAQTRASKKGRRKTAALVEFDEPKGKSPGKGRIYRQKASSKKKIPAKGGDISSPDGEVRQGQQLSPASTNMMPAASKMVSAPTKMNGTSSPQMMYKVHRPLKLQESFTPPLESPRRDSSPTHVPQPHGQGAEPNIKLILEATKNVLQSRTKSFLGNLKKNLKETFKESMMTEPTHPAMRIMAETYETLAPMEITPSQEVVRPRKEEKSAAKLHQKALSADMINFYNATKAASETIRKPSVGYNKKKLKAVLEKWVPHLNDMLHNFHQDVYNKKLAEFIEEKKLEQMPLRHVRDIFVDSLESSSSNEVPETPVVEDDPYRLHLGGEEPKRNKSPVNYFYDEDVNTTDIFSVLHAPVKKEIEDEPEEVSTEENVTSPENVTSTENVSMSFSADVNLADGVNDEFNSKLDKTEDSDDMPINYSDFDLDLSEIVYVEDPFSLPNDLHSQVSKLVLLCFELGIYGDVKEAILPKLSDRHKCFLEKQKNDDTEEVIQWSDCGDSENSNLQTLTSKCTCSSSTSNAKLSCVSSWEDPSKGGATPTHECQNCLVLSGAVIFMRCYFHFLNIPKLKRFIDHCNGNRRLRLWMEFVECLHVLADSSDPFANLIHRKELSSVFQLHHNQELIESPTVLSHVIRLFKHNEMKTIHLVVDLHKVISPLDVLYMCQDGADFRELYLTYLDRLLVVTSNTDAARESMIYHICQEKEVQIAWLECLFCGRTMDNSCSCGMPRPLAHTVTWERSCLINSVMLASDPCERILQLCRKYGFWQGYLSCLQFLKDRDQHLEILMQLGEFDLLENIIAKESENLGRADFENLVKLKQKQTAPIDDQTLLKPEHGEVWYCLNCGQHLPLEAKSDTAHNNSTGIDWSKLITWENLAKLVTKNVGYNNALDMLRGVEIQQGVLSGDFFQTCLMTVGVKQLQDQLAQDILERMDNYLWRRKPGYLAPQLANMVQKESSSGGGRTTEKLFSILNDQTEMRSRYLENPACHWGVQTDLKGDCLCCSLPLTAPINQAESGLVIFNCGHVYHRYCVPQKLCPICLNKV